MVPSQNLSNICSLSRKKKFIVVKKCNPACFVPVMRNTMLVTVGKSRCFRPFIKGNASLLTIWSKCYKVVVDAVVAVEIKVFKAHHLVKFNPFWEELGSILNFKQAVSS